jgi:hypothetical protein
MMRGNSDPKDYALAIFDTATDLTVVSPFSSGFATASQGPPMVLAGLNGQTDAYQRGTIQLSPRPLWHQRRGNRAPGTLPCMSTTLLS